jgi:hypothetical protein
VEYSCRDAETFNIQQRVLLFYYSKEAPQTFFKLIARSYLQSACACDLTDAVVDHPISDPLLILLLFLSWIGRLLSSKSFQKRLVVDLRDHLIEITNNLWPVRPVKAIGQTKTRHHDHDSRQTYAEYSTAGTLVISVVFHSCFLFAVSRRDIARSERWLLCHLSESAIANAFFVRTEEGRTKISSQFPPEEPTQ